MDASHTLPPWKDKILFTPGPLTTSKLVKQAMLTDIGSWDYELRTLVKEIRQRLLEVAGVDPRTHTAVLMQGSGSFGVEAVLSTYVPRGGKLLVGVNGAYGKRMVTMAGRLGIDVVAIEATEDTPITPARVVAALKADRSITNVALVHCETTTGILNPVEAVGKAIKPFKVSYFVDAMSSFGAMPIEMKANGIDFLVSSANKCIEGVPGFSFIICRLAALEATEGQARTLSLDLLDQYRGFEKNGQFRFTAPTHSLLAFRQALREFEAEGLVAGRKERYVANYKRLLAGMRAMGFREYVPQKFQGHIITAFYYPKDKRFVFQEFYDRLHARNYIIYSGKITSADTFRIGNIGRIKTSDIDDLLAAIAAVLAEMRVKVK